MYRPKLSPVDNSKLVDGLVTNNILSSLHATGLNLMQPVHAQQQSMAATQSTTAGPMSTTPPEHQSSHSDSLLSHLVRKVLELEKDNEALRQQLQASQAQIQQQCSCSQSQQATQNSNSQAEQQQQQQQEVRHLTCEVHCLRQQCRTAWQQVSELKAFLQDYGLIWVGQRASETSENRDSASSNPDTVAINSKSDCCSNGHTSAAISSGRAESAAGCRSTLPFDVLELQQCIDDLNNVVSDGTCQLKPITSSSSSNSTAKTLGFYTPIPVKLIIFKDGLKLHTAPARPYSDPTTDAILIDIFEGYFPSVLRREYPDGVPLQLVDMTDMSIAAAAAAGYGSSRLCGGDSSHKNKIHGFTDLQQQIAGDGTGHDCLGSMSKQEFLQKLPKAVIRNQLMVPVASAVEQYLDSSSSTNESRGNEQRVYIRTSASNSRRNSCNGASGSSSIQPQESMPQQQQEQEQQATIQVKSEDGKQTYVLKLSYTATIHMLRAAIDRHRASHSQQRTQCQSALQSAPAAAACSYELRSAFPARVYDDASVTLEAAGLVPSATLYMKHCSVQ